MNNKNSNKERPQTQHTTIVHRRFASDKTQKETSLLALYRRRSTSPHKIVNSYGIIYSREHCIRTKAAKPLSNPAHEQMKTNYIISYDNKTTIYKECK